MDVLEQVARLLSEMEAAEQKQQTDHEFGKGVLLHEATRDYMECVRARKWKHAHDHLIRIFQLVTSMISDFPTE